MYKRVIVGIFLITAFLIVPVSCKKSGALSVGSVDDFRTLIAKDAAGYVIVDFQNMFEEGIFDDIVEDPEFLASMVDFQLKTDIDIKKALEIGVIVFLNIPTKLDEIYQSNFYIVASGDFDQNKIISYMKTKGDDVFKILKISGYTLYSIYNKKSETNPKLPKETFFCFKNSDLIIYAGNLNSILTACKIVDGKRRCLYEDSNLYTMTEDVNQDHLLWGLFKIPSLVKQEIANGAAIMFPALKDITNIYLGGTYNNKRLAFEVNLFTSKEESLVELTTAFNKILDAMKNMVEEGGKQNADVISTMALLKEIQVSQEKNNVKIELTLTKAQISDFGSRNFSSKE